MLTNFIDFFMAPAYAASSAVVNGGSSTATATTTAGGGSPVSLLVMFLVFFLFFYFVMWRPQSKRTREHRELITALSKGDEVITSGGILGKVSKITEQYILLTVYQNTDILIQKSSVASIMPKGTLKSLE